VAFALLRGQLWNPQVFLWVVLGTLGVVGVGCLSKVAELSSGGSSVASMLGGEPVNPHTRDADERKLLNIVEEMAIASGVPVPPVYVMNREAGINAFAAGYSPSDAVVGVTRGCIQHLNRDELQGVIAHEFSHILNGDMRLNIRLIGLIFGIMCLAVIGRILLHVRGGGKDRNALPLLGLALLAIGGLGALFGRLMQSAVSRQREFLADASAVQFTRNPEGLASALKKIGALAQGSKLGNAHALEANHLFFSAGASSLAGMFASHPPLEERIRRLDPQFDGDFTKVSMRPSPAVETSARPARKQPPVLFPETSAAAGGVAGLAGGLVGAPSGSIVGSTGSPTEEHLRFAVEFRDAVPEKLRAAAGDAMGAQAVILGLLLSRDEQVRAGQLRLISQRGSVPLADETRSLWAHVSRAAAQARLPLVDLALPALRLMSPSQFGAFRQVLREVVEFDRQVDLFEYVLLKIVMRHLEPHFVAVRKPVAQFYHLKPLGPQAAVLLSALAYLGGENQGQAILAFNRGAAPIRRATGSDLALLPREASGLGAVDTALERFAAAVPQIKRTLLEACVQTVAADGLVREREAELLRAIGDALDCPLPPILAST
jgi:Zn-dependent protease with chaperone function